MIAALAPRLRKPPPCHHAAAAHHGAATRHPSKAVRHDSAAALPLTESQWADYPTLGMHKRNFDKHVNSLFHKLGVHKRSGAVRLWELFGKRLRGGLE